MEKQLWKQTIERKIENQQTVLQQMGKYHAPMQTYLENVKSGDATNMEGIAAQHYWKHLLDPSL